MTVAIVWATVITLSVQGLPALACAIKIGQVYMASNVPDRPYNPNDQGSNWAEQRKVPTTLEKIVKIIKGKKC